MVNPQDIFFGFLVGLACGAFYATEKAAERQRRKEKHSFLITSDKPLALLMMKSSLDDLDVIQITKKSGGTQ
ncbi:MAG: hypothetical protein WC340_15625 [Kiritimatiellia bacterium]